MKKVYDVKVKLLSPMHINGGVSSDGKRITVRSDNKPFIPATLFKGLVRNNFEMLINTYRNEKCNSKESAEKPCRCMTCTLFGKAGFQRSRIIFDNLESDQKMKTDIRTNVSVNRYLRKVNDGALVFSEVVSNFDSNGDNVVFTGQITVYYPVDQDGEYEKFFKASIQNIDCIGLGKSRGLGFVDIEVEEA